MADEARSIERERYHAYLLRLWQVESEGCAIWRASLEDSHTGQRRGFATIAQLVAFLETQAVSPAVAPASAAPGGPSLHGHLAHGKNE